MERLGDWKRDFKVPQVILRWLGTMAVVVGYFCRTDQVAPAVSLATWSHLGFWWTYYVCSAFYEHPSELSNFEEFRDFIFRLPEFSIWRSTTLAFIVALVTTFFPKEMMVVPARCYMLYLWGCPFCILLVLHFVLHGQETSLNNSQVRNEMDGGQGPNEMEPPSTSPKKEK